MEKIYNPKKVEHHIQKYWKKNNLYLQNIKENKKFFCIMMPPPNITGNLHMGHAFQQTIMDVLIRYNRMCGKNVLFQMGIDHAGIATQIVVERYLLKTKGRKKKSFSREEFINEIFVWKKKFELNIINQVKRLGNLINFNDLCFTLDKNFSKAVKKAFIMLYKDGLIYKKKKLVYWDTSLKTVISDLEVENKVFSSTMYYIKYPIFSKNNIFNKNDIKYLTIATTRPETLLGDTALAVNPNDIRYNNYIGKFVKVPIINRIVPIIGDNTIDINKGTGCMKVTPAHDFHDYHIAQNNKLFMINIFTLEGKILHELEIFNYKGDLIKNINCCIPTMLHNKDKLIARENILYLLKNMGLLKSSVSCTSSIPCGDRSGTILEPMLTNQWYLRTKSLAKVAITLVKEKKIIFFSKQYKNMYLSWMNKIEDWCISRQLWWGHQIPIWYDYKNNKTYVGKDEKTIRKENSISDKIKLVQDQDVLDTWFSSSLWTLAGLGWPNDFTKLKYFHPTSVIVSGFDIIFFWIARMVMVTSYITKKIYGTIQIPFKKIYITGLIKDEVGQKMSKSKGNTLDPLDMMDGIVLSKLIKKRIFNLIKPQLHKKIEKHTIKTFPNGIESYGADALRFTFLSLASTSRNINWDMNRLKGYKYFCNKIWNASRFIFLNTSKIIKKKYVYNFFISHWIKIELNKIIKNYHICLKKYRFDMLTTILYKFVWYKFCDKYLEIIKPIFETGSNKDVNLIKNTLIYVFNIIIRLLHPIMPFITETLWNNFNNFKMIKKKSIILTSIPKYKKNKYSVFLLKFVKWFQKVISIIRKIRINTKVKYNIFLTLFIKHSSIYKKIFIEENYNFLKKILFLKNIITIKKYNQIPLSIYRLIDDVELFIPVSYLVDINVELIRLNKEIISIKKIIIKINKKLQNENFMKKAPHDIILEQKNLLNKNSIMYNKLLRQKNFLLYKNI